jgi:hypothetical protein
VPQQKFHLDAAKKEDVLIQWKGIWKNVTVSYNGTPLGEPFANLAALKQGNHFTLPDGRDLHVIFATGLSKNRLEFTLDGRPLPGSAGDPAAEVKLAAFAIWFIAGLSTLLGVLGMSGVKFLAELGFGWPSLVAGIVFAGLGYLVHTKRSQVALAVALALFAVDTVLMITAGMDAGGRVPTTGLIIRVFLFIPMVRGFGAIKKANAFDAQDKAVEAF